MRDQPRQRKRTWAEAVDPAVLMSLSQSEVNRQEAIHTTILQEEQYREDLLTIETVSRSQSYRTSTGGRLT